MGHEARVAHLDKKEPTLKNLAKVVRELANALHEHFTRSGPDDD